MGKWCIGEGLREDGNDLREQGDRRRRDGVLGQDEGRREDGVKSRVREGV